MKILFLSIFIAVIGIVLLSTVGGLFIKEITQEVSVADVAATKALDGMESRKAPFWDLPDLNGNRVLLSDYADKPLVLTFWTTWNELATDQFAILDEIYSKDEYADIFNIVAIASQESKGKVFNFISRGGYGLPALLDESGAVGEEYGLRQTPTSYFIDNDGLIKEVFVGVLDEKSLVEKVEKILR